MKIINKTKNLVLNIVPESVHNIYRMSKTKYFGNNIIVKWEKNGKQLPPPHVFKQNLIKSYQKKTGIKILIETGTYMGDMVYAMKNVFDKIYSIELSKELFGKCQKRFRKNKNVILLNGDSGEMISSILKEIKKPVIFWLDSHYSGGNTVKGNKDTPIADELRSILENSFFNHIILIDDARCFNGSNDYPTINELNEIVLKYTKDYELKVNEDVICLKINKD